MYGALLTDVLECGATVKNLGVLRWHWQAKYMLQYGHPLIALQLRVGTEVVVTLRGFQGKPEARVFRIVGGYSLLHGKSAITAANEYLAFGICILDTADRQKTS